MRKVFVVSGIRTPFARIGGPLRFASAVDLGFLAVRELLHRAELLPAEIDRIIISSLEQHAEVPNAAADVARRAGIAGRVPALTMPGDPAAGLVALQHAFYAIRTGEADSLIVGGIASPSNYPVFFPASFASWYNREGLSARFSAAADWYRKLRSDGVKPLAGIQYLQRDSFSGQDDISLLNAIARRYQITREQQDAYAQRSHELAARHQAVMPAEGIMPLFIPPDYQEVLETDNAVRTEVAAAEFAQAPPIQDARYGSVTTANSAPFADGAAMLLLMSERRLKTLGKTAAAELLDVEYAAAVKHYPGSASAFALARTLKKHALTPQMIDVMELHEKSAVAVLALERLFADSTAVEQALGGMSFLGGVRQEKVNCFGGSIALGDALAASGARLVLEAVQQLKRGQGSYAVAVADGRQYRQAGAVLLKNAL